MKWEQKRWDLSKDKKVLNAKSFYSMYNIGTAMNYKASCNIVQNLVFDEKKTIASEGSEFWDLNLIRETFVRKIEYRWSKTDSSRIKMREIFFLEQLEVI